MKKLWFFCLMVLFACSLFISASWAQGIKDLGITKVVCPPSVKAGTSLTVTVHVENTYCSGYSPTIADRAMVALVGNTTDKLGEIGIWGPFQKTISWSIPPCQTMPFDIKIIGSVPSTLINKMALAVVTLLTQSGDAVAERECIVRVVP